MVLRNSGSVLKKLREVMKNTTYVCQTVQAYIVPSCDAHQSEYIAACDKRQAYVSGFTGSAGTAIITDKEAALWTDGRYFLQAQQELSPDWILMKDSISFPETPTQSKWLISVLPTESRVGFDPLLTSFDSYRNMLRELKSERVKLVPVEQNLIDLIWSERPERPSHQVQYLPIEYTGETWKAKLVNVQESMQENKTTLLIVTALDEIAWLLNLRGSDISYNPVFFAYVIVTPSNLHLFIDKEKLTPAVLEKFKEDIDSSFIKLHSYESVVATLESLLEGNEGKAWVSGQSSYAIVSCIPKERRLLKLSPIATKKALKNDTEIACMRNAHIKDAVALCEFYVWLQSEISDGYVTEISAAEKLESFRRLQNDYVGPSFETISGSGPNASIVHYRVSAESDRKLTVNEMYLCDSGGQYRDGTTDVTRTWHFGIPNAYEKECYTRVLKGHIALSNAVFPKLVKGQMLDTLARMSLWEGGLDYLHGTGHGVGMYLNVHEGPMGISFLPRSEDPGLQPGMILSIEPGYYEDEQFGIRLENLAVIVKTKTPHNFQNKQFLTFDALTLFPFQKKLIDPSILTDEEIKWLNDYHVTCREVIGKVLEEQGKAEVVQWLLKETLPLG